MTPDFILSLRDLWYTSVSESRKLSAWQLADLGEPTEAYSKFEAVTVVVFARDGSPYGTMIYRQRLLRGAYASSLYNDESSSHPGGGSLCQIGEIASVMTTSSNSGVPGASVSMNSQSSLES